MAAANDSHSASPLTVSRVARGVPRARVNGYCATIDDDPVGYFDLPTNILGEFVVDCNSPEAYRIRVWAELTASGVAVNGRLNEFAGASGPIYASSYGQQVELMVVNNQAAQVFINHNRYHAGAAALFGRSRGPITYRVSNSVAGASRYEPNGDFVRIFPERVWGRDGIFVAAHEYGHAFHYVAIDPWVATSYYCSPTGVHEVGVPYTTACAYVEGFADFFAARVINVVDGSIATFDLMSQNSLETNVFRTFGVNGLLVEGAFAALLMDMVDLPGDDDAISGDDESLTLSHYDLSQIMKMCRMSNPSTALLTHSDQFVYCAAGVLTERTFAPSAFLAPWGVYSGMTYDAPTALPLQSAFRAAWRFNFYDL